MNENRKHHHHVRWWSELRWKVWAGLLFLRFLLFSQLFGDGVPRMKETTAFLFIFFLFLQRKRAYSVHESEPQSQQVTWSQGQPTSPDGSGNTLVHILMGEQFKLLYPAGPQFLHICKPLCLPAKPPLFCTRRWCCRSTRSIFVCTSTVRSQKMPNKSKKKKKPRRGVKQVKETLRVHKETLNSSDKVQNSNIVLIKDNEVTTVGLKLPQITALCFSL